MRVLKTILIGCLFAITHQVQGNEWQIVGFDGNRIHSIAVHPESPDTIFVGVENGICRSQDGGIIWDTSYITPSVKCIAFDPINPNIIYAIGGNGSYSDGIYRSTDGGDSWNPIMYGLYGTSMAASGAFLIAGFKGDGVYQSTDTGNTWNPLPQDSLDLNVLSVVITHLGPPFLGLAAGAESGIYSFCYGWHQVFSGLPAQSITPSYPSLVYYAALGKGTESDGVYKSTTGGSNWDISIWLTYPTFVLMNALDSTIVYAASCSAGVMITRNEGINWDFMNEGLDDSVVFCLAQSPVDTSKLYAGTLAGLYVYDFSVGIGEKKIFIRDGMPYLLFNTLGYRGSPFTIRCWVPVELSNEFLELKIYDASGRLVEVLLEGRAKQGWDSVIWKNNRKRGVFTVWLKIGSKKVSSKLILL